MTPCDQIVFEEIGVFLVREGVTPTAAVPILVDVYAELEKGDDIDWLFLCRVDDVSGTAHAIITREPAASARRLMRFKIDIMRSEAAKQLAERDGHQGARPN